MSHLSRRDLLKLIAASTALGSSQSVADSDNRVEAARFSERISLSQWCFHRAIFGNSRDNYSQFIKTLHQSPDDVLLGRLDPRDITKLSRQLGVDRVDLVNILFFGHAEDKPWLDDFKLRAKDNGVSFQLLMCDETGAIGASNAKARQQAIDNHKPWFEAAAYLGCKQIRVNAYGDGTYLQQLHQCAESLAVLASIGNDYGIEVLVENHGNASNNGAWLAMLIELTNHPNLGVFTDLDNFFMGGWGLNPERRYDRVQGLIDLAPYTRGVSVKSHDFDASGRETTLDYPKLLQIFQNAGFNGLYSAEFEGEHMSELSGTTATIRYIESALMANAG
ncbi:xylose isomerase [Neiella marina]|uniref:Xylose isomerase n=1 Tax=Neiella marina TaxID=508461 RepID=A0A8J2U3Y1_9GAMM|nr:TIM barrel protein [Neiella marina]GGA72645.1 xylose isomerase [Neiella marina]